MNEQTSAKELCLSPLKIKTKTN